MSHQLATPEERYAAIVEELLYNPDVTPPSRGRKFGASGLKVRNKIFALLISGKLVVKLPKYRVDELVASGDGERWDPSKRGRLLKEWIVIDPTSDLEWLPLAQEAMDYVSSKA